MEHFRTLVSWAEAWRQRLEAGAPEVQAQVYERFVTALKLARKVLNDREPAAHDKILSLICGQAHRRSSGTC